MAAIAACIVLMPSCDKFGEESVSLSGPVAIDLNVTLEDPEYSSPETKSYISGTDNYYTRWEWLEYVTTGCNLAFDDGDDRYCYQLYSSNVDMNYGHVTYYMPEQTEYNPDSENIEAVFFVILPMATTKMHHQVEKLSETPSTRTIQKNYFGPDRTQFGNYDNDKFDFMIGSTKTDEGYLDGYREDEKKIYIENFEIKRQVAIMCFDISTDFDEKVMSATLTVDGDPIACDSARFFITSDKNNLELPEMAFEGETYNQITITPTSRHPRSSNFQLWFYVMPGEYNSMTLDINTQSRKIHLTNDEAGSFERNVLTLSKLEIPWDEWSHNGNTLYKFGTSCELLVPDGAAPEGTVFSMTAYNSTEAKEQIDNAVDTLGVSPISRTAGYGNTSTGYALGSVDLGPHGTEFSKPVTVTIPLESSISASIVPVFFYNENNRRWEEIAIADVNKSDMELVFQVDHFSRYSLINQKSMGDELCQLIAREKENGLSNEKIAREVGMYAYSMYCTTAANDIYCNTPRKQTRWFQYVTDGNVGDLEENFAIYASMGDCTGVLYRESRVSTIKPQYIFVHFQYQIDGASGQGLTMIPLRCHNSCAYVPEKFYTQSIDKWTNDPEFWLRIRFIDEKANPLEKHVSGFSSRMIQDGKKFHQYAVDWNVTVSYTCDNDIWRYLGY